MSTTTPLQRYERLGRGLGQPLAPGPQGALPVVQGPQKVREALLTLLDTDPGERVMRPDFGCGLRRYLMHPNEPATRAAMQREIEAAVQRWEPRVRVVEVLVLPTDDRATVRVELHYEHVLDRRQDVLVYPFYLEGAR
jgi:phage baseplate assembly protein W